MILFIKSERIHRTKWYIRIRTVVALWRWGWLGKSMGKPPGCWLHDSAYIMSNFVCIFKTSTCHTLQWKYCCCLVTKLSLTLCNPTDYSPPELIYPWDFPDKNTGVDCHFLLQGILLDSDIKTKSPTLEGGFFITEPPGKPSV